MANTTISGLPSTSAVDPVNDFLAIDTASPSATNKINRNNLLQLASAPVGLTDSQTLTNKTLTAPTVSGPTLSGTVLGTYTLGGTPTFPSSVVTLTGSQTLTSKTLTSPTITGGTYDNGTITVDSISGHTTSTVVTVGGVQMNNGVIGTSGAVTTNSIAAGAVVPNSLMASSGTGWAWQTWTPTWTNLTTGNGTTVAKYVQTGKTVMAFLRFTLGTTSAVGTSPTFTLPVSTSASYVSNDILGQGAAYTGGQWLSEVRWISTTTAAPFVWLASGTYVGTITTWTSAVPASWATGESFNLNMVYEAA